MDDFSSPTGIKWSGTVGTVEYGGGDRSMVAIFYNEPRHNPAKSTAEGRPVYDDVVMVRIHPPGERLNIVVRPANATDKRRFPVQWNQFQENRMQIPEGTPVDLLYPDKPSIAAALRAQGVHTVEQCAQLSADAIESIGMGAQKYVNDSVKFLEMSNKGVKASQMRQELEERDREIHSLKHMIEDMKHELDRLRDSNSQQIDASTLQQILAGMQGRPVFPATPNKSFDAQTAQINATHATNDIKPKRQRARIRQTA